MALNLGRVRYFIVFIALFFVAYSSLAQVENKVKVPPGTLPMKSDSIKIKPDSLLAQTDSLGVKNDSTKTPYKSDIETTINYTAKDSIRASMDQKMIWLYGDAKIKYGEIELEAEEIVIDYARNTLTAHGRRDSLGNRIGFPVFKNGAELYETKDIIYNIKTGRARISEVVTKQGEAFLHGDAVFKNEKGELLSIRNSYTTCNLEEPHFRIRATKTKAIPGDKIVAGPFYMEFNKIPTPLGFLFGMFPSQRNSTSGIIFPAYGEDQNRGFSLRGGGYFFDINEYMKLAITTDIYSKGSTALYINSNYSKRYHYSGTFNFSHSNTVTSTKIEDPQSTKDFRLAWSHTPQTKGTGRFSASVNVATATFNKNNNLALNATSTVNASNLTQISTKLTSNVSYSKKFSGTPFSMGLNANHSQDLNTKAIDLLLPSVTLNMVNQYPFLRKGKTGFFDNFSVGYSMAGTNRITNNLGHISPTATKDSIAPFNMKTLPTLLENSKKGFRHTIPISFSMKILKFLTLSPSINYEEKWYFEKLNWTNPNYVLKSEVQKGFNRIANYSVSAGLTTRLYGFYPFKHGKIKAIRHVVNPSISFGYTPNFATNPNYFDTLRDKTGKLFYQAKHQGFVYGPSGTGKSGSIGFGIGNNLEMKVQGEKDTVARKVMLLNNFSINSSYNLIADSFKLAPFSIAANTNVLDNKLNINLSSSLDPYNYIKKTDENGKTTEKKVDQYAWKGGSLGRITTASLAISSNLNPKKRAKDQSTREKVANSSLSETDKQYMIQNPDLYIDFDIPWNLRLSYNMAYSHSINSSPKVTQTLQFSGDVSLSAQWKVTFNSGYHFETSEFTQTNLGISRDLHCWTMRFDWVPFGKYTSYTFRIAVKSSILQDLKMDRRKPFYDNL